MKRLANTSRYTRFVELPDYYYIIPLSSKQVVKPLNKTATKERKENSKMIREKTEMSGEKPKVRGKKTIETLKIYAQ